MRSPLVPPRRASTFIRYLIPSLLIAACLYSYTTGSREVFSPRFNISQTTPKLSIPPAAELASGSHPIDGLIRAAETSFVKTLSKESFTLPDAATAYRERRGRHPPPGFDVWYKFATERNAIVVEGFWDHIYHDLEPFWALRPARIRKAAWDFEMRISIRNGKASTESDWFWTRIWLRDTYG